MKREVSIEPQETDMADMLERMSNDQLVEFIDRLFHSQLIPPAPYPPSPFPIRRQGPKNLQDPDFGVGQVIHQEFVKWDIKRF